MSKRKQRKKEMKEEEREKEVMEEEREKEKKSRGENRKVRII